MGGGTSQSPRVHLVYLRGGGMVLTKRADAGWRELQDEFEDYMTSLGPWTEEELVGFLREQYGGEEGAWGFTRASVRAFMRSPETLLRSG